MAGAENESQEDLGWVFRINEDIFDPIPKGLLFLPVSEMNEFWEFLGNDGIDYTDADHPPPSSMFGQIRFHDDTYQDAEFETVLTFREYTLRKRALNRPKLPESRKFKKAQKAWTKKKNRVIRYALPTIKNVNEGANQRRRRSAKRKSRKGNALQCQH